MTSDSFICFFFSIQRQRMSTSMKQFMYLEQVVVQFKVATYTNISFIVITKKLDLNTFGFSFTYISDTQRVLDE